MDEFPFKSCTICEQRWKDRDSFLADAQIKLVGYQVNYTDLKLGLFLFNHLECKTTLSVRAELFVDLYEGEIFKIKRENQKECPSFCMNKAELRVCPVACECSYVREILQIIRNWPKDEIPSVRSVS